MTGRKTVLLPAVLCLVFSGVFAESAERVLPPSLTNPRLAAQQIPVIQTGVVDHAALAREDAEREADPAHPGPVRFAVGLPLGFSSADAGYWTNSGQQALWRVEIDSPGAQSLNLRFSRFDLPQSALLWLHDHEGGSVQGPFTSADRDRKGGLSTPVILGDRMVVEVVLAAADRDRLKLDFDSVFHGYRYFQKHDKLVKQGSCNIDVVCSEADAWRDQIRAVARYTIDNQYLCTGTLMNNTAEDGRALFLTADHCNVREGNAHTVVVYWNYESPSCGMLSGGSFSDVQHGASFLSTWNMDVGSDFTLMELDAIPTAEFHVYYAGWDRSGVTPQSAVAIHHPEGDEKAISFENDPLTTLWGTHWKVRDWDLGTTEPGSSGSCLFNPANGLCIGQETGGYAACGNDEADWFGKISVDWDGGGSSESRVSDYLDPLGTGVLTLEGRDSGGVLPTTVDWLIPVAASTEGSNGADWKTEIGISNPADIEVTADLSFVGAGHSWPGDELLVSQLIPAGGALYLDDPLIGLRPTSGLIVVSVSSDQAVVSTRTYNQTSGNGTFGQGIPAIRLSEAVSSQRLILPLIHSIPDRFHTNFGMVQTTSATFAVKMTVHSASGEVLGSRIYSMTGAFFQVNRIIDEIHQTGTSLQGAWIEAELIAGSPSFWTAYASVVDEITGDPTYVMPVAAR